MFSGPPPSSARVFLFSFSDPPAAHSFVQERIPSRGIDTPRFNLRSVLDSFSLLIFSHKRKSRTADLQAHHIEITIPQTLFSVLSLHAPLSPPRSFGGIVLVCWKAKSAPHVRSRSPPCFPALQDPPLSPAPVSPLFHSTWTRRAKLPADARRPHSLPPLSPLLFPSDFMLTFVEIPAYIITHRRFPPNSPQFLFLSSSSPRSFLPHQSRKP